MKKLYLPMVEALGLLLIAGVLSVFLAKMHPGRKAVGELASIRSLQRTELQGLAEELIRVAPGPSTNVNGPAVLVFTNETWDDQAENLAEQFHGREWILVECRKPGCEEGWMLAKQLRRYGFPNIALLREEDRR